MSDMIKVSFYEANKDYKSVDVSRGIAKRIAEGGLVWFDKRYWSIYDMDSDKYIIMQVAGTRVYDMDFT